MLYLDSSISDGAIGKRAHERGQRGEYITELNVKFTDRALKMAASAR